MALLLDCGHFRLGSATPLREGDKTGELAKIGGVGSPPAFNHLIDV
jgi:hypothetical protein